MFVVNGVFSFVIFQNVCFTTKRLSVLSFSTFNQGKNTWPYPTHVYYAFLKIADRTFSQLLQEVLTGKIKNLNKHS